MDSSAAQLETISYSDSRTKTLHSGKLLLVDAFKTAFAEALEYKGKLSEDVLDIDGMSGRKYRYFINNLVERTQNPRYLEVGSWAGSTLCSAIYGNSLTATAIDNWSQFNGPIQSFFQNVARNSSSETKISILTRDFRRVPFDNLGRFNIYLFDGPHDFADQYDALVLALNCLDNEFVFIVDDWNWEAVRLGTIHAIADLNLEVVSSIEIRTTNDGSHPKTAGKLSDWHNGYFLSVLKKS
jgi:hypothetical protein